MPEPLSTEGVVAGLGQGVARDSPGVPAARAQEHSLVKAFVLDLPHSGGWAPMVPCVSVYLCVCVHALYVFAGHGSLCQREMLPVLGWRWGGGPECVGFSALQEGDGLSLGALASETPRLVSS